METEAPIKRRKWLERKRKARNRKVSEEQVKKELLFLVEQHWPKRRGRNALRGLWRRGYNTDPLTISFD